MRYFVTGATGFIGKALAKALLARGDQVVIVARTPAKADDLKALGAEIYRGDITEFETMRAPMRGTDGVFHVAGWYKVGVKDKSPGWATNVEGTRNVLTMMRDLNIAKGVYTSTLAVNSDTAGAVVDENYNFTGTHQSEYDRTKAVAHDEAEQFIRDGLPLVIVMPGLVYGPGDEGISHDIFVQFLARKMPMIPSDMALAWGYIDDIVQGHIAAMDTGRVGESYMLAGPPHKLTEAITVLEELSNVPAPKMRMGRAGLRAMSQIMGIIERLMPVPSNFSSESLRVFGMTYLGDSGKAKRELGFNPRSIEDGLRETLKWEQAQLHAKR